MDALCRCAWADMMKLRLKLVLLRVLRQLGSLEREDVMSNSKRKRLHMGDEKCRSRCQASETAERERAALTDPKYPMMCATTSSGRCGILIGWCLLLLITSVFAVKVEGWKSDEEWNIIYQQEQELARVQRMNYTQQKQSLLLWNLYAKEEQQPAQRFFCVLSFSRMHERIEPNQSINQSIHPSNWIESKLLVLLILHYFLIWDSAVRSMRKV